MDTNPGTGSKCNCGFVQVGDIDVYEEGTIEVRKVVLAPNGGPAPQDQRGLFNLRIDGEGEVVDAADGDTSGPVTVGAGTSLHPGATHVVDETAGTGADLASYKTSISCDNGESCEDCPSLDVTVESDSDVVCTITNKIECPDCDDGEYCNGEEECDEATGQCVTNSVPDCDDGLGPWGTLGSGRNYQVSDSCLRLDGLDNYDLTPALLRKRGTGIPSPPVLRRSRTHTAVPPSPLTRPFSRSALQHRHLGCCQGDEPPRGLGKPARRTKRNAHHGEAEA